MNLGVFSRLAAIRVLSGVRLVVGRVVSLIDGRKVFPSRLALGLMFLVQ